jgi:hypothetical protein
MAKIKIHTGRGTGTIEVDDDPGKWSGAEFRKIQEARKEKSKDKFVSTGRGTGKRKLGDTPKAMGRPKYKGTLSSGRGTGSGPHVKELSEN